MSDSTSSSNFERSQVRYINSGSSWESLRAKGLEEEEGRSDRTGVKKAWIERRDSTTY